MANYKANMQPCRSRGGNNAKPNNHYSHAIQCYVCGSTVITNAPRAMCDECAEQSKRECDRRRYKYKCQLDADAYMVVEDPDKEGGYSPGAVINREQLRYMLLPTFLGFTVGTLLRNKKGDRFVIHLKEEGGLILEPL
jgi:hypothetical protein